jgi:hypothetical protein
MAFSGNYMCTSFKQELLVGSHNFTASTGDTFKLAMYTNSASFDASTTDYTEPAPRTRSLFWTLALISHLVRATSPLCSQLLTHLTLLFGLLNHGFGRC